MNFGAIYGVGEGMQGQAYALPTKDLRVKENKGLRSISAQDITKSIKKLYKVAKQNPNKKYLVNDYSGNNLNGYTGVEMAKMFSDAGPIPSNMVFNENFVKVLPSQETKRSLENKRILLYKELFQTVEQYPRIIKSIDTQKLKSNAYELIDLAQERDDFDGLKLFTGEFQQDLKTRFSAGAAGVGATANNTIDNVMAQGAKLHVPFLGMQSKTATIGEELRTILYSTDKINGV